MPTASPKDIATAGSDSLQGPIDILSHQRQGPGADIPAIDARIDALEDKQTALQVAYLEQVEESDANTQAIAAMKAASSTLTQSAAEIKDDTAALTKAAGVVNDATTLVSALAPFLA